MTAALTSVGVQQVSITIANGATSGTATITTVGTGAYIILQGQTTTDATTSLSAVARVELTNPTTVTAVRNTASTDTVTVNADVIDGDTTNFVKTVQHVTTTITTFNTTANSTITAVTNNNTFLTYLGVSTASALTLTRVWNDVTLSGTTLTATRGASLGQNIVGSCVVELQAAALASNVQNITVGSAASGTTFSTTITSVTTTRTFLANCGAIFTTSLTAARQEYGYFTLTGATTVTIDVNQAPSSTGNTYAACVVEVASALLAQNIQRGTISLTAATSNTATITSSPTAETMVNWLGNSTSEASITFDVANYKITQTNATTLTMTVNTSGTGVGSYEAVDFNPAGGVATIGGFPGYYRWFIQSGSMQNV